MHLLCDAIKIFEALSPGTLEHDISEFQKDNKVKSIDLKIQQKSQKGYMLRDRVGDKSDIYNAYIAVVIYERDLTQERVEKAMEAWVSERVNVKFKDLPTGPARIFCVDTLQPMSVADKINEYVAELLVSDEYMKVRNTLEEKYSIPEGGKKL